MSIEHLACVLHHSRAAGTRKLVLLGIANHEGDGGSWPAIETLAVYANVHERNVQKAITWLVSKGELRVHIQDGGDHHTNEARRPNRYEVLVACPPWCDRTPHHRDTRRLAGRQLSLNGVAHTPPHLSTGVAHTPPVGVALAPPKPPIEPQPLAVVPNPLDTRACSECGQHEQRCQLLQARWPREDRHSYRPVDHARQ